jgi:hypothetical protein
VDTACLGFDAGVPWRAKQSGDARTLRKLPHESMFTPSAADDQHFHGETTLEGTVVGGEPIMSNRLLKKVSTCKG